MLSLRLYEFTCAILSVRASGKASSPALFRRFGPGSSAAMLAARTLTQLALLAVLAVQLSLIVQVDARLAPHNGGGARSSTPHVRARGGKKGTSSSAPSHGPKGDTPSRASDEGIEADARRAASGHAQMGESHEGSKTDVSGAAMTRGGSKDKKAKTDVGSGAALKSGGSNDKKGEEEEEEEIKKGETSAGAEDSSETSSSSTEDGDAEGFTQEERSAKKREGAKEASGEEKEGNDKSLKKVDNGDDEGSVASAEGPAAAPIPFEEKPKGGSKRRAGEVQESPLNSESSPQPAPEPVVDPESDPTPSPKDESKHLKANEDESLVGTTKSAETAEVTDDGEESGLKEDHSSEVRDQAGASPDEETESAPAPEAAEGDAYDRYAAKRFSKDARGDKDDAAFRDNIDEVEPFVGSGSDSHAPTSAPEPEPERELVVGQAPSPAPAPAEVDDAHDKTHSMRKGVEGNDSFGNDAESIGTDEKVSDGALKVRDNEKTSKGQAKEEDENTILAKPDEKAKKHADAHAEAMGTAGAGEEVISTELREAIVAEHGLAQANEVGFKMDAKTCGKAGPVALITVWGSVPKEVRRQIVLALDSSGIEDGGEGDEDRGIHSWRAVGAKTLRIINIYRAVFGGKDTPDLNDPEGRRTCVANFFVNSKMASSLSAGKDTSAGKSKMAQAESFRNFFLKNVLPADDKRGDHDAMVFALAVNCQTTKRMQLLWKLYGALASKFGLTKNDLHLSVGVPQVKADVQSLLGVTVDDLLAIRDRGDGWKRGDDLTKIETPICPALLAR